MSAYPVLTIVTALSRPHLLPPILASLNAAEGHALQIRHLLVHPHGPTHPGNGRADMARNVAAALDTIPDGWVWILDDDNTCHPSFLRRLAETIADYPDKRAIVFSQERGDDRRYLRAAPENVKVGSIDTAQFVLRRDLIGDRRWCDLPVHDGIFIVDLYSDHADDFVFVDEVLTYFNHQTDGPPRPAMVNLGCGRDVRKDWINIDRHAGPNIRTHDIRQGLPFFDHSVDYIYASHVLEHLDYAVGVKLLEACYRVLLPEGVLRLVQPDIAALMRAYVDGDLIDWRGFRDFVRVAIPGVTDLQPIDYVNALMFNVAGDPHRYLWDVDKLRAVLEQIGFTTIRESVFDPLVDTNDPFRINHSFYLEAHKGA